MLITSENTKKIQDRFFGFNDSVVRHIEVFMEGKKTERKIIVGLSCKDLQSTSGWSTVTIELEYVISFKIVEENAIFQVLSDGLHFFFKDNITYLDFCPYSDPPESVEIIKKSLFYVSALSCKITDIVQ